MDSKMSLTVADNVRVWLLEGGKKQAELAEMMSMSVTMLSFRIMGQKLFREEDIDRLVTITGMSRERLLTPCRLGETMRRYENRRKSPEYRVAFGARVSSLAQHYGKTVRELAADLGMDYSGVCKWVMGKGLPSPAVLLTLAKYFVVTPEELAGFDPIRKKDADGKAAETEPEAAEPEPETAEAEQEAAEAEQEAAEAEQEAAEAEQEAAEAEPETAEAEPEKEKTGKCRTVDERREMFRDRLRELIERSGKTAEEVARDTEVGLPLLQGYLEGKYFPGYLMAQKLAEYFHVSTEVLSGEAEMPERNEMPKRNEMPERNEKMAGDYQRFAERLKELIRRTGKESGAVCYEIGIGMADWDGYLRGCWLPSMKIAKRIAKYFGVSVAVLLGDEELPPACRTDREPENEAEDCWLPAVQYSEDDKRRREGKEIVSRAERISLKSVNFPEVIETISLFLANIRDICEYEPERNAIMAGLAALIRAAPQKVIVDEGGNARCPVCGLGVEHGEEMCKRCCQLLDWEIIEVGDEVYMSGDWSVRFWVGGKEENGFIWGYDMSFQRCCEHPADLVRSGRNCPELVRGLEAAARIEQQEGGNEKV